MKKILILLSLFLLSISAGAQSHYLSFNTISDFQNFMRWRPGSQPLVSCHRGGPAAGFPENAIETFANSVKHMPCVIECDIAISRDSVLVMMHDDKLDRTSTGTGPVSDRTMSELKVLRLKDNEGKETSFSIPTLEDVLKWGRGKVIFTLDIKRGVPYQKVTELVKKTGSEANCVIITYSAKQAAEVYKLAPELMISASVRSGADLERLNNYGVPDNRLLAFVGTSFPPAGLCEMLHDRKIRCIAGTMGNLDRSAAVKGDGVYTDLVKRGVDIISTDRWRECGIELKRFADKQQRLKK